MNQEVLLYQTLPFGWLTFLQPSFIISLGPVILSCIPLALHMALVGFKPLVVPNLAKCWDYSCVPLHPAASIGNLHGCSSAACGPADASCHPTGLVPGLATVAAIPTDEGDAMYH